MIEIEKHDWPLVLGDQSHYALEHVTVRSRFKKAGIYPSSAR